MFKVVATQEGHYNQILRTPGEVFELLRRKDGAYRAKYAREPVTTAEGVPIPGQFKKVAVQAKDGYGRPYKGKDGKFIPEHEDYAEDRGNVAITEGPNAGESIHLGWMFKVPDNVPVGIYPEGVDFWNEITRIPPPGYVREIPPGGTVSRAAAPIKSFDDDKVYVVAPGTKDRGAAGPPPRPPGMSEG